MPMTSQASIISGDAKLRTKEPFRILCPVHWHPCQAAFFPGAPDGRKLKRCHALGSVFFPGAPGWMPFQTSSNFDGSHPGNRRSKGHRENSVTGATLHPPALWPVHRRPCRALPPFEAARNSQILPSPSGQSPFKGTPRKLCHQAASHPPPFGRYIGIPAGQPVFRARPDGRPFKRVPISMVPILAIATQRNIAKTLPQEQPRIPRPLAGASASLPGPAPYRSKSTSQSCRSIRAIATQRNIAKTLPQGSLASPALWPVHRCPCRALPPFEAARTSQSLPPLT